MIFRYSHLFLNHKEPYLGIIFWKQAWILIRLEPIGHVSVNATNTYAEINIQMKENALKTCEIEYIPGFRAALTSNAFSCFLKVCRTYRINF
jgi:hypothetical protein